MGQRVKDAPEEFPCEVQLFLRGDAKVGPARGQAVIFPTPLIVVGEELGGSKKGTHNDGGGKSWQANKGPGKPREAAGAFIF